MHPRPSPPDAQAPTPVASASVGQDMRSVRIVEPVEHPGGHEPIPRFVGVIEAWVFEIDERFVGVLWSWSNIGRQPSFRSTGQASASGSGE